MVKTRWRCETAASRSRLSHSAHSSACLFSHEQRAVLFGKALGVDAQELLEVLLDQTEER
jgi:hypothetical protein